MKVENFRIIYPNPEFIAIDKIRRNPQISKMTEVALSGKKPLRYSSYIILYPSNDQFYLRYINRDPFMSNIFKENEQVDGLIDDFLKLHVKRTSRQDQNVEYWNKAYRQANYFNTHVKGISFPLLIIGIETQDNEKSAIDIFHPENIDTEFCILLLQRYLQAKTKIETNN